MSFYQKNVLTTSRLLLVLNCHPLSEVQFYIICTNVLFCSFRLFQIASPYDLLSLALYHHDFKGMENRWELEAVSLCGSPNLPCVWLRLSWKCSQSLLCFLFTSSPLSSFHSFPSTSPSLSSPSHTISLSPSPPYEIKYESIFLTFKRIYQHRVLHRAPYLHSFFSLCFSYSGLVKPHLKTPQQWGV